MIAFFRRLFGKPRPLAEPATIRDAPTFARLHRGAFEQGWSETDFEQILIERNATAHRVRLGGQTVGFIVSRRAGDEAEILSVAVAAKSRGMGIGQNLLLTHLAQLAAQGVRTVFLEVEASNLPAQKLYTRTGFRDVGLRPAYYRRAGTEPAPAHVMRRDLI